MKKRILCFLCAVLLLILPPALTGCSVRPEPEPGPVMYEVYDDELYTVDAGRPFTVSLPGGGTGCAVRLHIANRTDRPLVLSTVLCMYAESGGRRLECRPYTPEPASATDAAPGLDGRIAPGYYADGWVSFPAEADGGAISMSIAADYCAGKWITFELPAAERGGQ